MTIQLKNEKEILSHFRHPVFRPGQKEAILECVDAFDNKGKQFVISELPTGVGKSDIAYTLATHYCEGVTLSDEDIDYIAQTGDSPYALDEINQVYVTTSQKILQDQYLRDFKEDRGFFYDIRGATNYDCINPRSEYETTCKENGKVCPHKGKMTCTYHAEKIFARTHPVTSLNNAYYYAVAGRWPSRELAVFDECHNLPDNILDIISFQLSDETLMKCALIDHYFDESVIFKEGMPNPLPIKIDTIFQWTESVLGPLAAHATVLSEKEGATTKEEDDFLDLIAETIEKIKRFLSSRGKTRWIGEVEFHKKGRIVRARPLDSGFFAKSSFFYQAERFALQSATIVDPVRFAQDVRT